MKRKKKRKKWLDNRSKRIQRNKNKRIHSGSGKQGQKKNNYQGKETYTAKAPEIFSFIENTEETIEYFVDIINQVKKGVYKQRFYINASDVSHVTTDALVYILAILYSIKHNISMRYEFKGTLPQNENAKKVFLESGFLNYVSTRRIIHPTKTDDKIQIITGKNTNSAVAKNICDFVSSRFNKNYKFTIDLYKTLIELMSNTVHHAYDEKGLMAPCWYLYAINKGKSILFAFIDTGNGIPSTVKRKWIEKLPLAISDSELIYSAFLGESRTETGLYNRGHGLPALYEKVKSGRLKNFYVLSGSGSCRSFETENDIIFIKENYKQKIFGTIVKFEITDV